MRLAFSTSNFFRRNIQVNPDMDLNIPLIIQGCISFWILLGLIYQLSLLRHLQVLVFGRRNNPSQSLSKVGEVSFSEVLFWAVVWSSSVVSFNNISHVIMPSVCRSQFLVLWYSSSSVEVILLFPMAFLYENKVDIICRKNLGKKQALSCTLAFAFDVTLASSD